MDEDDWYVECSDEEVTVKKGVYEPPPEVIEKLYDMLDNGIMPELKWQSPGYRPPTPTNLPTTPTKEENAASDEKSDFDFMDEMNTPRLPVRRDGEAGPKGSAKKKTTSLDGVLSNMRRHWRLDQQMMDANQAATTAATPTTTTS